MNLEISRFAYTSMGTFGEMYVRGERMVTVERPWLDNRPSVSCIPEGVYFCRPRFYNRGGYQAVEILDVPHRSHILFHRGNTMHDSAGCVLVTSREGVVNGLWAGVSSAPAFARFMEEYGALDSFRLTIRGFRP